MECLKFRGMDTKCQKWNINYKSCVVYIFQVLHPAHLHSDTKNSLAHQMAHCNVLFKSEWLSLGSFYVHQNSVKQSTRKLKWKSRHIEYQLNFFLLLELKDAMLPCQFAVKVFTHLTQFLKWSRCLTESVDHTLKILWIGKIDLEQGA